MEIDLIAGLTKPKIALSALPTLENPELPEGELADFKSLFDGVIPEETGPTEDMPTLSEPRIFANTLPQELAPKANLTQILEPAAPTNPAPDKTPETTQSPESIASPQLPDAPLVLLPVQKVLAEPTPRTAAVEAPAPAAIPAPAATIPNQIFKTDLAPEPLVNPGPRIPSNMWTAREPAEVITPTVKTPDVPNTTAALFSPLSAEKVSILPAKTRFEPQVEAPVMPEKTAPKVATQMPPPPTPALGFANTEVVKDDPAEVQFNIKIERQVIEAATVSRPAPQAPPVASQITAQLPQLLTKAEKQTIELRLDPPELGRVTIHLTTNDTQVTAQVVAERVDTIDLMRRHAELLAATLARAGFSEANLSFQQGHRQGDEGEFEQFQGITGLVESEDTATPAPTLAGQDGRLDIRL
ncbi:MAG: hypothetical protein GQ535_09620 [Rhodobacteraceae bacterium]|nr:hypothetical protein [Paracoccaceae bacterium]